MGGGNAQYVGLVSSDWSECLSPNGPFDPIAFTYPELKADLEAIFRDYTGNRITLREATERISSMLPAPLNENQMDAYLEENFRVYRGVRELIEWCLSRRILFMINTTGTRGYFQRAIAKGLLPALPFIAANPMIRYSGLSDDERFTWEVHEISDKPRCTEAVLRSLGLDARKLVVMGDSGGDGPHFEWAASHGAFLVSSMCKDSLSTYCRAKGVEINRRFGLSYGPGEKRDLEREMEVDFMDLSALIAEALESQE